MTEQERSQPTVRVVFVIRRLMDVGGAQTQVRLLAGELVRRGHQVVILTERVAHIRPSADLDGIPIHPIRSVAVRLLGPLVYVAGLIWYLIARRSTYDVIHVFLLKHSALAATAAGALARAPVVIRAACAGPPGEIHVLRGQPVWRQVMKLCRRADAFVALSDALAEELVEFGCPRNRVHRIPSGMSLPGEVMKPGQAPPLFLFAGRLDAQKNLTGLLEAWRGVQERHADARLDLYGSGPQREELEALSGRLGVTKSVTFGGVVDDIPERLARARALVLFSTAEGMSSALLEAMAAGRAIVATRVSGTAELITDGEQGLLVEPGDVPALAAALERVIADPDLADRLGRAARRRIEDRYTVRNLADRHLTLYRALL